MNQRLQQIVKAYHLSNKADLCLCTAPLFSGGPFGWVQLHAGFTRGWTIQARTVGRGFVTVSCPSFAWSTPA